MITRRILICILSIYFVSACQDSSSKEIIDKRIPGTAWATDDAYHIGPEYIVFSDTTTGTLFSSLDPAISCYTK